MTTATIRGCRRSARLLAQQVHRRARVVANGIEHGDHSPLTRRLGDEHRGA
ncbi:hypothetical protein [Kribbella catacumbae]|uniref:hypothetical protein n=1 Tax=Kribbella catacumbae TaxID=460086 RepID=UPI0003A044EC|nr:hypothetical protein [Kribbella catacumbae]